MRSANRGPLPPQGQYNSRNHPPPSYLHQSNNVPHRPPHRENLHPPIKTYTTQSRSPTNVPTQNNGYGYKNSSASSLPTLTIPPPARHSAPATTPFYRVPIAGIEHHLDALNRHHQGLSESLLNYSYSFSPLINHQKTSNIKFQEHYPQVLDKLQLQTRNLIQVHKDQKNQIINNFQLVLRNKSLPSSQQVLASHEKLKRQDMPQIEKRIREKTIQINRQHGNNKLKYELESLQRKLDAMKIKVQNPPTRTKATFLNGVLQDVVLPAMVDFSKQHARHHKLVGKNLSDVQEKTFSVQCTEQRFTDEMNGILSDLEKLEIIDKPH